MTPSVAWELARSGHLVRSLRLAPFVTCAAAVAAFLAIRRGDTHDVIADLRVLGLLLALGSGYVLDDGAAGDHPDSMDDELRLARRRRWPFRSEG